MPKAFNLIQMWVELGNEDVEEGVRRSGKESCTDPLEALAQVDKSELT